MTKEVDFTPGRWALVKGWQAFSVQVARIDKVTPQLIKTSEGWGRQHNKADVLATFETRDEADKAVGKIAGINGERTRRIAAANTACGDAMRKFIATLSAQVSA